MLSLQAAHSIWRCLGMPWSGLIKNSAATHRSWCKSAALNRQLSSNCGVQKLLSQNKASAWATFAARSSPRHHWRNPLYSLQFRAESSEPSKGAGHEVSPSVLSFGPLRKRVSFGGVQISTMIQSTHFCELVFVVDAVQTIPDSL